MSWIYTSGVMTPSDHPWNSALAQEKKKTYSYQKVRTSLKDRTLDSMFPVRNPTQIQDEDPSGKGKGKALAEGTSTLRREIKESECLLTSVKNLRQNVTKLKHRREFEFMLMELV